MRRSLYAYGVKISVSLAMVMNGKAVYQPEVAHQHQLLVGRLLLLDHFLWLLSHHYHRFFEMVLKKRCVTLLCSVTGRLSRWRKGNQVPFPSFPSLESLAFQQNATRRS